MSLISFTSLSLFNPFVWIGFLTIIWLTVSAMEQTVKNDPGWQKAKYPAYVIFFGVIGLMIYTSGIMTQGDGKSFFAANQWFPLTVGFVVAIGGKIMASSSRPYADP